MAAFNLRRFSKPGMLRRIDPAHLVAFLEPHADYFSDRSVELPSTDNGDELDYNALSQALLNPNATTPDDLAEALVLCERDIHPERIRLPPERHC